MVYLGRHCTTVNCNQDASVCFQEVDDWYTWAYPESELWEQLRIWFMEALSRSGIEPGMGLLLYRTFTDAGLPGPRLRLEATIGGGPDAPAEVWANLIRGALPVMERLGLVAAGTVDPDSLTDRLLAEVRADSWGRTGLLVGMGAQA